RRRRRETWQCNRIDGEDVEVIVVGQEVVVVGDDDDVTTVGQVGTEGNALDLLGEAGAGQAEGRVEEIEERLLGDRGDAGWRSRGRQRRYAADVGSTGDVNQEEALERRRG